MRSDVLQRAYAAIGDGTPLRDDCGALCGAACCQTDANNQGGVALVPGEEAQFRPWARLERDPQMDAPMIRCDNPCDRDLRPFLCRIFPLCPTIGRDGRWTVRMDARARAMCPLTRFGVKGLDLGFVRGCVRAVRILAEDPACEDFFKRWAAIEAEFRRPLLD